MERRISSRRLVIVSIERADRLVFLFVLQQVVQGIQRRLRVARAAKRPGEIARLDAQALLVVAERQQPHQRAPALERLADVVNRDGVGPRRRLQRGTDLAQDVERHFAHRMTDGLTGMQCRLLAHTALCPEPPRGYNQWVMWTPIPVVASALGRSSGKVWPSTM